MGLSVVLPLLSIVSTLEGGSSLFHWAEPPEAVQLIISIIKTEVLWLFIHLSQRMKEEADLKQFSTVCGQSCTQLHHLLVGWKVHCCALCSIPPLLPSHGPTQIISGHHNPHRLACRTLPVQLQDMDKLAKFSALKWLSIGSQPCCEELPTPTRSL